MKKRNNFKAYQEQNQNDRKLILGNLLDGLEKGKVYFKCSTHLAKFAAEKIREVEHSKISHTTLLRNSSYSKLINTYVNGPKSQLDIRKNSVSGAANFEEVKASLELSNMRADRVRLLGRIAELEARQSAQIQHSSHEQPREQAGHISDLHLKFGSTCQAMRLLLRHFEEQVAIDVPNGTIVDRTRIRNNVIVNAEVAAAFFSWLEQMKV